MQGKPEVHMLQKSLAITQLIHELAYEQWHLAHGEDIRIDYGGSWLGKLCCVFSPKTGR